MIRKINKIMALMLIAASISTAAPIGTINAYASVNDNSKINLESSTNRVTLASSDSASALEAVQEAMIPGKLNKIYGSVSPMDTVSQFEKCGTLSYTLDDAAAKNIADTLKSNMSAISSGVTQVYKLGGILISLGLTDKGKSLQTAAAAVGNELKGIGSLSDSELIELVKGEAQNIPVYKYTVVNSSGKTVAQGFTAGGTLGLALNPVDTYNGMEKDAKYSSSDVIPSLPLSGASAYNKKIDLTSSGTSIICDGLNINIIDSAEDKVYAINNPVYNLFLVNKGAKTSTTEDVLNIVDFSGVTKLKGSTSNVKLSTQGISTSILSISLTTSDSKDKDYKYALTVGADEKNLIDAVIDKMNLGAAGDIMKDMIKADMYILIPDANTLIDNGIDKSGIGKVIHDVTAGFDDANDALDDLTDALKDKNDDVDDAWDKVFDRFDNDPGWKRKDGYMYYYDKDGVSLKGVQTIKGKTYYFNKIDGAMETGWQIVDGKKCYFDKKKGCEVYNQWVKDGDDWYFVGDDGVVKKMQWVNDGGTEYYLKADGKMTRDWLKIDDYWYCFNESGAMETSTWKWSDGKWYYLKDNGQTATGWLQLGNNYYYFKDPSGEMQTGWFRADGNWYCSNDDGSMKTGWAASKDGWCYLDDTTGIMKKNQWVTVDGNSYYFNVNGIMVTGSRYIDGTKYVFNSDGTLSE